MTQTQLKPTVAPQQTATTDPIYLVNLKRQTQQLKPELEAAFGDLLTNTDFVGGKAVSRFEEAFARYCGVKHCIGVGNGTDALHLIFKALGLKAGDEVIVPSMTFIATGEIFTLMGAKPVFADVDPATYTLDPESVKLKITDKTKAIVPVHLYGQPADMKALKAIANDHNLWLVEDSAQAHGAYYNGFNNEAQRAGSMGIAAGFSFYPGKNLGAFGDGGAVTTNDDALAEKIRAYSCHGSLVKYEHIYEGINSRLDTIQAAILDIKLKHLDRWSEQRQRLAGLYTEKLSGVGDLILPLVADDRTSVFHLYVVQTQNRDALMNHMKTHQVFAGIHYPIPLHLQQAFGHLNYQHGDFPVSEQVASNGLSLPLFPEMTDDELERVCQAVKSFFA